MKRIKKIPKHLLEYISRGEYELLCSYNTGLYLIQNDQLLYFTSDDNLSALSIQINDSDLKSLKKEKNLKFELDNNTKIIDLDIKNNQITNFDKIKKPIEESNPESAISGEKTRLKDSITIINKLIDKRGIESLLGRGLGLTPSGDDILSGISLVQHLSDQKILDEKLDLSLTNRISGALLKESLNGRYSEDIIGLAKNSKNPKPYIKRILNLGSTSGADFLTGLYYGLERIER